MQVLVVGAAGVVGEAIVLELRSCGYAVRIMTRSGRRVAHLRKSGATLEFGNLADARSLARACVETQALVIALPHDPFARRRDIEPADGDELRNLMLAARQSGVARIVLVSALGADALSPVPYLRRCHRHELYVQGSGLNYTILRPAALHEWFGTAFPLKGMVERYGLGLMPGPGRSTHAFVAAYDVARAVHVALARPEAEQALLPICGPESLSFHEAYARIARLRGRRIMPIAVPELLARFGALLARPLLPELHTLGGMIAALQHDDTCTTPAWLADALGQLQAFDSSMRAIYGCAACPAVGLLQDL